MDYQPENCHKCGACPEDILMLNCSHDICLECAANRFALEKRKNIFANGITCQICNAKTDLDRSSITELEKIPIKQQIKVPTIRNSMVQQAKKIQKNQKKTQISPKRQKQSAVQNTPPPHFNFPLKSNVLLCQQHIQDQISYFCLTCECECICPECVIHGPHKLHQVKTLKRAAPDIKQKVIDIVKFLESSFRNVEQQKSGYQDKVKYFNDQMTATKRKIKSGFEEVKRKIQEQQQICLAKAQMFYENSKTSFEKAIISLKKHMDLVKTEINVLQQLLKSNQLKLLNTYAKNKRKYAQLKELDNVTFSLKDEELQIGELSSFLEQLTNQISEADLPNITLNIKPDRKIQDDANKYKYNKK